MDQSGESRVSRITQVALALAVVVLGLCGYFSFTNISQLGTSSDWVEHTQEVLLTQQRMVTNLTEAKAAQRTYLLSSDPNVISTYAAAKERIGAHLATLRGLVVDNPEQTARVLELGVAVEEQVRLLDENQRLGPKNWNREITAKGEQSGQNIRDMRERIEQRELELLQERKREYERNYTWAVGSIVLSAVVSLGTIGLGLYLVDRDTVVRRRLATEQAQAAEAQRKAALDREKAAAEQERLSRYNMLLLNSTSEGIYGTDVTGACTFVNAAAVRILGLNSAADILGKATHPLIHHSHADGAAYPVTECPIYGAIHSGEPARVADDVFFRPDGAAVPVEYSASPVRRDGRVEGAVVAFNDITERKKAEAILRDREEQFSTMAEAMPQLAWMTDSTGAITWYNQRWYDYTGTTFEQMQGWGWKSVHHPDELARVVENFSKAISAGSSWEDTFPLRRHTGEYRTFLSRAVPVRGPDGKVSRWFGTNTDIEEQQQIERELALARESAEQANVAKSQFLANMSHELRTPLNAVILYSELLQEEAADRGIDDFGPDLEKIRTAGKHLLSLVNSVLDISKIEAGKMDLYLETFDVDGMLSDVASTIEPLVAKKGNALVMEKSGELGKVHGDLTKVRQILFNFLSNSAKFTENGTITLRVERGQLNGREVITYLVRDTGIGMTDEQLAKLFQPFTQADESTTRKYGGTGLGLTICKKFAEMMGGDITVSSIPDQGTTFTIHIPTTVGVLNQAMAEAGVPRDGACLVIDDNPEARDFIIKALAKEGIAAVAAADGEAGLALAKTFKPAAIFLDVIMPKLDGWAVLSALKRDPATASVPVIMLTVAAGQDLGYSLGAAEYLTKPVDAQDLTDVIRKYCEGKPDAQILVVDDDETTRSAVIRALARSGFTVDEAVNGRDALDKTNLKPYALVILDLIMPELDGFGFLREFRKTESGQKTPVVITTSKDLTNKERDLLNGQVEAVMQKGGYSLEELQAEIRRLAGAINTPPEPKTPAAQAPPAAV